MGLEWLPAMAPDHAVSDLALPSQDEAGFLPNTSINVGLNAIVN